MLCLYKNTPLLLHYVDLPAFVTTMFTQWVKILLENVMIDH